MTERQLLTPAFPDDTGEADPALATALATYDADATRQRGFALALAALQTARLLVPVVAVLGEIEVDPDDPRGLPRDKSSDKSSDMAAVLVQGPDGRRGLLAFTATGSLSAWNPEARPVPVTARTAALAAVQEGAAALIVDLAGPVRLVVEGDHLTALAAGWTLARVGDDLAWLAPGGSDSPSEGIVP